MPARGCDGFPGRGREVGGLLQFLAGESNRPPDSFHCLRFVCVENSCPQRIQAGGADVSRAPVIHEIVVKKVTVLVVPHQRQHGLLAGGGALPPKCRVAEILAERKQFAAEFAFEQLGEIRLVFVEQRVQVHSGKIRRAVVKTVRRVVAGFALRAVVLEELVKRQAVRLQLRMLAGIKIFVQKAERCQRQVGIFRFDLGKPRFNFFVVVAWLDLRARTHSAVVVTAQFVLADFHEPVLAEPDVLVFRQRGFQRGRQPVFIHCPRIIDTRMTLVRKGGCERVR